jgi:hypothetical protein
LEKTSKLILFLLRKKKGGYTRLDSQAETTGKGPFDLRAIMIRKQMFQRSEGVDKSYPNPDDVNLGCAPGEFLMFRKGLRTTSRSGARSIAVFSSLNGEWWGRYQTLDGWKRDHGIAGVNKTLYNLPGAPSTATASGSDYQTDSGLAWLESGSISASRNTGSETIEAGDLVVLDLPPTQNVLSGTGSFYMSPNNPNGGMPLGKYVMVTRPYRAEDQLGHLMTISALLRRSHTLTPMPGVLGLSFNKAHFEHEPGRTGNSILNDSAQEAITCFHFSWGLFFAVFQELLSAARDNSNNVADLLTAVMNAENDNAQHAALVNLFEGIGVDNLNASTSNSNVSIRVFEYVFLQHNALVSTRNKMMKKFKDRNGEATIKNMRAGNDAKHHYAFLTQSPLQGLYQSFARSAAHNDAYVVGRALSRCGPGETLDILVGCRTRPTNR